MKTVAAGLVLALVAAGCSGAQSNAQAPAAAPEATAAVGGVADPVAFVQGVYDSGKATAEHGEGYNIYSKRLRALFEDAKGPEGELGRLEMDFWTNAQDDDVKIAKVAAHDVDRAPARKVVAARFDNIRTPTLIHSYWERGANGRWHLDDVHNVPLPKIDSAPWTLSLILKYGDYGSERVG